MVIYRVRDREWLSGGRYVSLHRDDSHAFKHVSALQTKIYNTDRADILRLDSVQLACLTPKSKRENVSGHFARLYFVARFTYVV